VELFENPVDPLGNWITLGAYVSTEGWDVHGGLAAALLGDTTRPGVEYYGDEMLYTGVTVPSSGPCSLGCWVKRGSYEKSITWDWQNLEIRNAAGDTVLGTIFHVCDSSDVWEPVTADLSPWAGQTVVIYFLVHGDLSYLHTWMLVDDFRVITGIAEGGDQNAGGLPTRFAILGNRPNPTAARTSLSFALPKASPVHLRIYNVTGALVRTVVSGSLQAGVHTASWDLRDDHGNPAANGVYIWRLKAGPFEGRRKTVVIR